MKELIVAMAVVLIGCDQGTKRVAEAPSEPVNEAILPQAPASKPSAVVEKPADQAQLDRMILAGYTPHADHLHPPGVKECPLSQGTDAVM